MKPKSVTHSLKIWPKYFVRVEDGTKTFEVRKNDRDFQTGDIVLLREWNPQTTIGHVDSEGFEMVPAGYTGAEMTFRIGYVLPVDAERVAFSLLPVERQ